MKNGEKAERGNPQIEDRVFKYASTWFWKELFPYLEICEEVCAAAPTEMIHLELKQMYQDFNYVLKGGGWLHFEFVSGIISTKVLRKFRRYEAVTSCAYDVPVTTYVVYTGKAKAPRIELTEGINTYRVRLVRLKDKRAEDVFKELMQKKELNIVNRSDMLSVVMTPLLSGKMPMKARILKGLEFLRECSNVIEGEEYQSMVAMLYALATKFLDNNDMKEIMEVLSMTVLGEMLMEKGEYLALIRIIMKKARRGQSIEEIAEDLVETPGIIEPVYYVITANPEFDENAVYRKLTDKG